MLKVPPIEIASLTAALLVALGVALPLKAVANEESGDFVRLVAALDEPEYYCFDLAGWGKNLLLDDPLQTHTCKTRGGEDQMFHFTNGRLEVSRYNRCVQVAGSSGTTLVGSAVLARPCSDSPLQQLSISKNGRIRIANSDDLCLGAGMDSTEASGPSHVWRTLSVVRCGDADEGRMTWQIGLASR